MSRVWCVQHFHMFMTNDIEFAGRNENIISNIMYDNDDDDDNNNNNNNAN